MPPEGLADRPEPARLDPERATREPAAAESQRRRFLPFALLGSLGVHLLPLLALIEWNFAPAEVVQPIPVQLVIEQPPPPPPASPPEEMKRPPPGRLASDDMGDPTAKPAAEKQDETIVAAIPPPKPEPPAESAAAPPEDKPSPPPDPVAAPVELPPPPRAKPPVKQAAIRPPPTARAPAYGQVPGPSATRDAYLAYCMTLVRRHFDLLPAAFLAGRRGATELKITVLDDGTIARISVAVRSPYPDIDAKIEQVVAAVGRFPPLPQWFQGPQVSLILHVSYPDGL